MFLGAVPCSLEATGLIPWLMCGVRGSVPIAQLRNHNMAGQLELSCRSAALRLSIHQCPQERGALEPMPGADPPAPDSRKADPVGGQGPGHSIPAESERN